MVRDFAGLIRLSLSRWRLLVVLAVIAGTGMGVGAVSILSLSFAESASFCSRCHPMKPEFRAYEHGPHRDVKCGECHVEPGIQGFVKSKINGSKELLELVLGQVPAVIEAKPGQLPPPDKTCVKCHSKLPQRPYQVIIQSRFQEDEQNTEVRLGVALRINGAGLAGSGGIHAHNDMKIQYVLGADGRSVDWIRVQRKDGSIAEYIAMNARQITTMASGEIEAMRNSRQVLNFGCTDCHNRAGHEATTPDKAVDQALSDGRIDRSLPFVKKEAVARIEKDYPDEQTADASISSLGDYYRDNYPEVFATRRQGIDAAVQEIESIYRTAIEEGGDLAGGVHRSNLGHEDGSGCFRCHDGGHVLVDNGKVTDNTLAWACSTCHSFPATGDEAINVSMNEPPAYHGQPTWLLDHGTEASRSSATAKACATCHTTAFCTDCHATGVAHEQMRLSHAELARARGVQTCSSCHQTAYCARCHGGTMAALPPTTPGVPRQSPTPAR